MNTLFSSEKTAGKGILILYWKIATQPVLYRELAANPYSPQVIKTGLANFSGWTSADIIYATALAEPEAKYDREFKKLPRELRAIEIARLNSQETSIANRLNEYVKTNVRELWEQPPDVVYERLFKVVFEITDNKEIEQRFPQKLRIEFRLLIIKYIELLEESSPIFNIPKLKLITPQLKPPPKTFFINRKVILSRQSFLAIYASTTLIFVSIPIRELINHQTNQMQIPNRILGMKTQQEILGAPLRLQIPSINVDADVEQIGINSKGEMEVPDNTFNAGWYKFGPKPGEIGSAVLAGHFDPRKGKTGVFDNLEKLKPGDFIKVTNDLGETFSFTVRESRTYNPGYAEDVFLSTGNGKHLNLITCDGIWNKAQKSYSKRLVVFADVP